MALPAAAAAPATAFQASGTPTNPRKRFWKADVDELPITEAPVSDTDADVLRPVVVDQELLSEEEEDEDTIEGFGYEFLETAKLLLSGGIAGALSKTTTAPLARLTILQQVEGLQTLAHLHAHPQARTTPRPSVAAALQQIIKREGVAALWKGNGVTIIHRLPYSAANFWVYENVNEYWKRHIPAQGPLALGDVSRRLVAGGTAGMTACTLAYPLDLVRTRLAAQTTMRYYTGINHALRTIVRDEGMVGLYRGLGATLLQVWYIMERAFEVL
jgi:hypothetical protein